MRLILPLVALLCFPVPAAAQRTDENAVADAEDAFGSSDGGENLGLYGPFDVRGFSPVDAGNVRIEGIYVDRQADLSPRLVEGSRIRVGSSAAGYAFPAPSGVVDYRLRTPGDSALVSVVSQADSFGGGLFEVDAALPVIRGRLSVGGGLSYSRSEYASGNNADITNMAAIAHWRSKANADAKLFWSRTRIADEDIYPIILGEGLSTPPRLERRRFLGQHWADVETERFNYGALGRARVGGFALRVGMLRSVTDVKEGHNVFLHAAQPGVRAQREVSAYPGRRAASTSGEISVARDFSTGRLQQRLQVMARGRVQERRYGGTDRITLPAAPFGEPLYVNRPVFRFSEQTHEEVRQWAMGLGYQGEYTGVGRLSGGVQKVSYRKSAEGPADVRQDSKLGPWLFNVAGEVTLLRPLSLFGSFTSGLEESDIAPAIAVNRDEAPPAIRTKQFDAGLRASLAGLTAIAGWFRIERPYHGLDSESVFRELGAVRHSGFEASLTGTPLPGLTIVAGGILLRAHLSGDGVTSGAIGNRPIDVPARKLIANIDWHPPAWATSFDLGVEHIGPNRADTHGRIRVAPYTILDLGVRHRFKMGDAPAVLRLQVSNLLNSYGWEIAGRNAFVYVKPRQLRARLALDF
jgi:iron complex outermembrane receptor protein